MFDLTGRVALITGATGGIGLAIAKKMKQAGATVVVSGRNVAKMDAEFDDGYIKIHATWQPKVVRLN
jgi:NAD(P)-dependent dehydrogenase (short-subunit alcohol dehydrogenase family)